MTKAGDKAKEITDQMYKAYGSDTGYLFGLTPSYHQVVEIIVKLTIEFLEKEKGGSQSG